MSRFPLEAFPPNLQLFAEAVAEHTQTPVELAACAMLGALSAAALGIEVDPGGWREELALYLITVMGPANRKSSVMELVTRPLVLIEREERINGREELDRTRTRKEAAERRRQQLLSQHAKAETAVDRAELMNEIEEIDGDLRALGDPHPYRLLAADATAEALGALLSRHGRIAVLSAEGAFLDNLVGGRYSDGSANLHLTCLAYNGESTVIDRRGRDPEELERPLLTVMLAVQEHHLTQLIEHPVARSQGLVSRFAFVMPSSLVGSRKIEATPIPPRLSDSWAETLKSIHSLSNSYRTPTAPTKASGQGVLSAVSASANKGFENSSPLLSFSSEARSLFDDLRRQLEPFLGVSGALAHVADWANRHPGRVARIAGLLHLAHGEGPRSLIDGVTMGKAIEIGQFLLEQGVEALEQPDATMRRAFTVLEHWDGETITVRDLHRWVLHARGEAAEAHRLAGRLVETGHLVPVPPDPETVGRPSPSFKISARQPAVAAA